MVDSARRNGGGNWHCFAFRSIRDCASANNCGLEQDSPPPRLLGAGFREFSLLPLAISFVVLVYLSLLALQ
jgi:hypothetical protein